MAGPFQGLLQSALLLEGMEFFFFSRTLEPTTKGQPDAGKKCTSDGKSLAGYLFVKL